MPHEDRIRSAIDQAVNGLHEQLEGRLQSFVEEFERAEAVERTRAIAEAVDARSEALRREADAQLERVRGEAAQEVEQLRRAADHQAQEHQREIAELRSAAASEAAAAKRAAEEQIAALRRDIDEVRRTVTAEAEERLSAQLAIVSEEHSQRMNAASATIDELKQQIVEVRRAVTAEADERLTARLAALTAEHERVLGTVVAKRDALQRELDETRSAAGETETRLNTRLMSTLAARETERSSSEATIASLTRRVDEVRAEITADLEQKFGAQLTEAIADLDRERASVEATIASLTHQIEEGKRAVEAEAEERYETQLALVEAKHERTLREAVERARQEARDEKSAQIARLEHAIRGLDGSRTLVTALEELGRAASREVDRVAVLVLKAGRLQGWRVFGFASNGARGIDLDVSAAGIAGDTVRSGAVSAGARLPEFARDGVERHGVAFPITVGWAVVAVLYADAPRANGDPQRWSGALDVLSRHASKVLEATTLQQAVGLFPPGGGPAAERMVEAAHVQAR